MEHLDNCCDRTCTYIYGLNASILILQRFSYYLSLVVLPNYLLIVLVVAIVKLHNYYFNFLPLSQSLFNQSERSSFLILDRKSVV